MQAELSYDGGEGHFTITKYSSEEIGKTFLDIYSGLEFRTEIADLQIHFLQFGKAKIAQRELQALSVALWRLALERSFPEDCEAFFRDFLENAPFLQPSVKGGSLLRSRIEIYNDMLRVSRDSNFYPVAQYLTEILTLSSSSLPSIRLKLSLNIRSLYSFIFDRLC